MRYLVLAWFSAACIIAYCQRNSLGVVEIEMREELQLTKKQSALAMTSAFFFAYALLQVPAGWVGHVWGSRRALTVFAVICSAATSLCMVAGRFPPFVILRGLMGSSQAGLFPCTTGAIKNWFPSYQWGWSNGMLTAFQQVGGAGGAMIAGFVAASFGWRSTFLVFGIPGLLWAIGFYFWFRDRPQDHPSVNAGELAVIRGSAISDDSDRARADTSVPWRVILLSPAMTWICTQQFFRGAAYIFYSTWFSTYLRESRGVDIRSAGWLTSLPLWANAIGCVAGGGFSDWLLVQTGSRRVSRQGLAIASQLAGAALVLAAYPVNSPTLAVLIISLGSFCAAAGGPIAYAITIDMGGEFVRPIFSLMNMWGNLGSFASPFVVAWLVGEGPSANWDFVLPVFAGMYVVAGAAWLGFNPSRPIVPDEPQPTGGAEAAPDEKDQSPNAD
ncbi:MAG TPA: MFS transporter [Planctomycetaceae bacterium]|nr:MFS transporter [Planctomycetaceae bacterium]